MLEGIIRLLEWIFEIGKDYISPFCVLPEYQGGVLMRMGKYKKNLSHGINWKIPLVDAIHTVITTADTFHIANVNVTTIDTKTINVGAVIEFEIVDVKKYLIDMNDADSNAHDIARGVIADYITDCTWEEIKDKKTQTKIKNKLKAELAILGINVKSLLIADIAITKTFTLIKE